MERSANSPRIMSWPSMCPWVELPKNAACTSVLPQPPSASACSTASRVSSLTLLSGCLPNRVMPTPTTNTFGLIWPLLHPDSCVCQSDSAPFGSFSDALHFIGQVSLLCLSGEQIAGAECPCGRSEADGGQLASQHAPHGLCTEHTGLRVRGVAAQNHADRVGISATLAGQRAAVDFRDFARRLYLRDAFTPFVGDLFLPGEIELAAFGLEFPQQPDHRVEALLIPE